MRAVAILGAMAMNWQALIFLGGLALAARGADRDVVHVFPVSPGAQLNVDFYSGAISVIESDVAEIRVEAHFEINSDDEAVAARLIHRLDFTASAEANTVTVRGSDPSGRGVKLALSEGPRLNLDCQITVPRQCNVDLRAIEGAINVGNLAGRVVVRATKGNVFLRRTDGSVDVRVRAGDVVLSRCSGDVSVRTENGFIRVGTVGGRAELKSAHGDIEVLAATGGLDVVADAGDVTAGFPKLFARDAKIKTAYGNITVKIDPAASCVVQASSFWGRVESKLPLEIESGGSGRGKLTGRLNNGGLRITLSADGGHVSILPGETLFN